MLTDNRLSEISMRLEAQAEEKIMQQLNWFIERGLLIVERGQSSLVSEIDPATGKHVVKFLSTVELKLKDKEYIEGLEAENKRLKERLDIFERVLRDAKL